jgi:hypothetical protein
MRPSRPYDASSIPPPNLSFGRLLHKSVNMTDMYEIVNRIGTMKMTEIGIEPEGLNVMVSY